MSILDLNLEEIKQGWFLDNHQYQCNYCEKNFQVEEVFPIEGRFFTAEVMIKKHLQVDHPEKTYNLIDFDSKYNTLTDRQKELLKAFLENEKDNEIAEKLTVTPSTIRHQRFTFREKAKQAKLYLATYESIFEEENTDVLPIPSKAVDIDDRFDLTEDDYQKIIQQYFDFSSGIVKLSRWPKQQKKIIAILNRVTEEIEFGVNYTEQELNKIIKDIYFDYILVRRYLVEYGFVSRKIDGSSYWKER